MDYGVAAGPVVRQSGHHAIPTDIEPGESATGTHLAAVSAAVTVRGRED